MKQQIFTILSAAAILAASNMATAADAARGKSLTPVCAGCHGANGISMIPTYPNLAGQKSAYLSSQIKAYRDGSRQNPTMNAMAKGISDADADDIAAYYSGLI